MNRKPVSAELLMAQCEQLLDFVQSPQRAAELAIEVGKLNAAVRDSLDRLDFNDEPSRFAARLAAHKGKPR